MGQDWYGRGQEEETVKAPLKLPCPPKRASRQVHSRKPIRVYCFPTKQVSVVAPSVISLLLSVYFLSSQKALDLRSLSRHSEVLGGRRDAPMHCSLLPRKIKENKARPHLAHLSRNLPQLEQDRVNFNPCQQRPLCP